ncbi:LAGLIDADG family homing endonuclease [Bacillus cereus]|uniref:LAGLIDADG family homing endonuclease n=1 Tax=Bacillus cereus TaxID=1396 RepID=UPI003C2FFA04
MDKGIVPNKTDILKFSHSIPDELKRHFVRGFIDGDGYITCYKRSGYGYSSRFGFVCNSKSFAEDLVSHLQEIIPTGEKLTQYVDRNFYCVDTNNQKQLLSIVDYLYKDSKIYLDRKYEKYKEVHHYLNNKLAYRKRNLTM